MKRIAAMILFLILIVISGCGHSTSENNLKQGETQTTVTNDNRTYNLEKYLQIKAGDTYETVSGLLGTAGEAIVDNSKLKQYKWTNEDKTSISVTFSDKKVVGKTQNNLGPFLSGTKKVTKAKYEQLKEGQSLQQVVDVLGPGCELMMNVVEEKETRRYIWQNSDGGSIIVLIDNDKVTKISDMMLD